MDNYVTSFDNNTLYKNEKVWLDLLENKIVDRHILRNDIAASWERCINSQVDPLKRNSGSIIYDLRDILEQEKNNLLFKIAEPFMKNLYEVIKPLGFIAMLGNEDGINIDMGGNKKMMAIAEKINAVKGASFEEKYIGTNAASICAVEKRVTQVTYYEHYKANMHNWCCSSIPIFNKDSDIVAVLNISNMDISKHTPLITSLITSTARLIEMKFKLYNTNDIYNQNYWFLKESMKKNPRAMLFLGNDGCINHINENAVEMLGVSTKDSIGRSLSQVLDKKYIKNDKMDVGINVKNIILEDRNKNKTYLKLSKILSSDNYHSGYVGIIEQPVKNNKNYHKAKYRFEDIKYNCSKMEKEIKKAKRAACNDMIVFINGESGTGKELFAQAIHNYGKRCNEPFIAVNCGALPRELIQSELFGYAKGAFTGAKKEGQIGKFQLAQKGTIFLDEIGDMPMELQANLLRILQEKTVTPLGSNEIIELDVRVIAATNKNLLLEVEKGNFREDLYYRISGINIDIPPLRERGKDIEELFYKFLDKYADDICEYKNIKVTDKFIKALYEYKWPGNVRELENMVISVLNNLEDSCIRIEDLPVKISKCIKLEDHAEEESDNVCLKSLNSMEMDNIEQTLKKCNNNISKSARLLGITRATLYRKIHKYKIKI